MEIFNRLLDYLLGEGRIVKSAPFAFCCLLVLGAIVGFGASEFRSGAKIDALEGAVTQYQAILAAPTSLRISLARPSLNGNQWKEDIYIFVPSLALGLFIGFLIWRRRAGAAVPDHDLRGNDTPLALPVSNGPDTREWLSTRRAMMKFVNAQQYKKMTDALDRCVQNATDQTTIQERLNNLPTKVVGMNKAAEITFFQAQLIRMQNNIGPLNDTYMRALEICLYELKRGLISGDLIAKAFKCPYAGEGAPELISRAQWHALNFDMSDSDWQTIKADQVKYIGLQIATNG